MSTPYIKDTKIENLVSDELFCEKMDGLIEAIGGEPADAIKVPARKKKIENVVADEDFNIKMDKLIAAIENGGGGGITPTGTIELTENGTYNITPYAAAEVNVPSDPALIFGMEFETGVLSLETAVNTVTVNFTSHSLENYDLMGCWIWTDNNLGITVAYDAVINEFEMLTDLNPSGNSPVGFVSQIYRYKNTNLNHFYQFNYNTSSTSQGILRPTDTPSVSVPSNSILFGATNNSVKIGSMNSSKMFLKSFEYKYILFFKPKA